MDVEQIARVCHEVNKAYCESLGDTSQPTWEEAPDWQKDSAVDGVNFHIANPEAGPEASHENWLQAKLENGWVWGKKKNQEKKIHPCIMSFNALPKEQQAKDFIFRQIIHSLS